MSIILKRFQEDVSSSVDPKSLVLTSVLTNEVSRLEFVIKNTPTKETATLGAVIDLYEDGNHVFGGTVTQKESVVEGGILIGDKYTVNDHSFNLNTKLVVRNYENEDPQDIVNDIVWSFTDRTFGTTGVVLGGFDVISIKFNYEPVTVALQKLATQIGWEWFVDPDKEVQFFPPNTVVDAPHVIDDTSGNLEWKTLKVEQSIQNMKNSIFVIGGTYTKVFTVATTPDKYLTDGTKSVFTIAYPYTPLTIAVSLAGVVQTLGTDQVTPDASVQVQYNEGERFVRFTTVPTTGQEVNVSGEAQIPILAHVQNQEAVETYGEIQDSIIDQQIKSIDEAHARGLAEIERYGSPVYSVRFATLETGFEVGQTVSVDSTIFGTDVLVIIKRITGRMFTNTQMRYEIECVGTEKVSFVDIMKLLLMQSNAQTAVDDSTVLQVLLSFNESLSGADVLGTPSTDSAPYVWGPDAGNVGVWNFATWG